MDERTQTAAWLIPEGDQQGLRRYVETVRERWKLIALIVSVTTLASLLYVAVADRTYEATANLLVTPVPRDSETLTGLGLIRDSSDPTRDVETAAKLVTTVDVAKIVKERINSDGSPRSLLGKLEADPIAQSNVVAVTASDSSARGARQLANAFGEAVVEERTEKLHRQLDTVIPNVRERVRQLPPQQAGEAPDPLRSRLSELELLRAGTDPTLRLETRADGPSSPAWPKPTLSILAGILAGLVLGVGGAFGAQMLDPRLRREEQLRSLYRLPVLARIPLEKAVEGEVIAPQRLSPAGVEAYRTLRATLAASRPLAEPIGRRHTDQVTLPGTARSVLITGASPAEGKTTTAVNLAASLALAGKRVILIEADIRRPKVAEALGVSARRGIASVLIDGRPLSDALMTSPGHGENLQLLLVDRGGQWMADQFSLPAARTLVDEAKQMADWVIIDSPPLTAVIDALPLVQMADDVLIVVRMGKTDLNKLTRLGELLGHQGIRPVGFALVGVGRSGEYAYYDAADRRPAGILRQSDRERTPVLPTRS
jgi:Mrp family chromosome partitioning ATPase/capsular polysaccharide biosynthesis protein